MASGVSDAPPVSAAAPKAKDQAMEAVEIDDIEIADDGQTEADAAVGRSCIDLVASGEYQDALPVCLEAASIDADDAEVQAALAKAQAETAAEAASGAATDAAAKALGGLGN